MISASGGRAFEDYQRAAARRAVRVRLLVDRVLFIAGFVLTAAALLTVTFTVGQSASAISQIFLGIAVIFGFGTFVMLGIAFLKVFGPTSSYWEDQTLVADRIANVRQAKEDTDAERVRRLNRPDETS